MRERWFDGAKSSKFADAGGWTKRSMGGLPTSGRLRTLPIMDSHEVMKEVLKRTSAKQIAADMGLSLSLIYKWAEPPEDDSGSGASSPLDRVGQLVRITKDARVAQWVCEQAGGFYIRNPQNFPPGGPLIPVTNDIVQEFADMLATIATSAADNTITREEAKKIRARWEELKSVTEGFVRAAEGGSFGPPKESEPKAPTPAPPPRPGTTG